jgi:hypothetical protein
MSGHMLKVDRVLFLLAHSTAKIRNQGVVVNGKLRVVKRRGTLLFGPFQPGEVVTYDGGFKVRFEVLDAPEVP